MFRTRLADAWRRQDSLLCVGLDPDPARFPHGVARDVHGLESFCREIIELTAPYVCAFKPQIAYFAALGAEAALERLCAAIRRDHPHVVLVLDAKRGDIGDTARRYAVEAYERYGADAVTVNPWLGTDSLEPFFDYADRGTFVLCRTSNPGSDEFQARIVDGEPLYVHVARTAADSWSKRAGVGLVVGATRPTELRDVRNVVGDMPLLVPGVGAQGGDATSVVTNGATDDGTGLLVNSSRAVLYAAADDGWREAARSAAMNTRDELNAARREVTNRSR
jgi:orotidine-5'-phosphate decarboxylase